MLGYYTTFTVSNRRAATLSQCSNAILVVIVLDLIIATRIKANSYDCPRTSIILFDLLFVKPPIFEPRELLSIRLFAITAAKFQASPH